MCGYVEDWKKNGAAKKVEDHGVGKLRASWFFQYCSDRFSALTMCWQTVVFPFVCRPIFLFRNTKSYGIAK